MVEGRHDVGDRLREPDSEFDLVVVTYLLQMLC